MDSARYRGLTDPELVSLCLKGEAQAWETLILRYRRLIYSIPVRFGFSAADASDVFQSVCLKLIESLHALKDETKVSSWLITTTTRQCIHVKALKRRDSGSDEAFEDPPDPSKSLEEVRIHSEARQNVRNALALLPERCQRLIEMLYFDTRGPSYEDVGRALGMPVSSIGPTRARCLEKLRVLLNRRGVK